jgi:hypothetical protein
MTQDEKTMLKIFSMINDRNQKAILLQSFIAKMGPLSEEAAVLVREQLKKRT